MLSRSNPSSAFTKIPPNTPTETCVLSPTVWRRRVNSAFSPTCAAKNIFYPTAATESAGGEERKP